MADYSWIGPAIQAGSSIFGEVMAGKSKEEQQAILQQALAEFGNISPPSLERVMAEMEGPSAFEGVQADPEGRAAQYAALDALQNISANGGHTLADDANLNRVRNQAAGVASSGRHRIAESMAARGQLNSGATLAMQLSGNEGAAGRASQEGMDIAGQAQRRALDAILQRGKLGGDLRQQQFSEDARKAEAADMRSRYNAQARQRAQYYNAGLPQQQYENQLNRARGMTGQLGNLASYKGEQAADTRGFYAGLGETGRRGVQEYQTRQDGLAAQESAAEVQRRREAANRAWDEDDELDAYGNPIRRAY